MAEPKAEENWLMLRVRQTGYLIRKNIKLMQRARRSTLIQIFVPFFVVLLLFVLQFALPEDLTEVVEVSPELPIPPFPRCTVGPTQSSCYSLAYVAPDAATQAIIDLLIAKAELPAEEVVSYADAFAMDDGFGAEPNKTQIGILFDVSGNFSGPRFKYTLQYNDTEETDCFGNTLNKVKDLVVPVQAATDQAILSYLTGSDYDLSVSTLDYPHPELISFNVVGAYGPIFFFSALMFNFVIQMGQIVGEKELKLREAMQMAGLKTIAYWFSWFFTNAVVNTLSVIVLILSGLIFQFDFFLVNSFGLYFFLFFLFSLSMVSFTMCMTVFVNHGRTATTFGFSIFLIGVIAQISLAFFFEEDSDKIGQFVFSRLPFVLLAKGITDISAASDSAVEDGMNWDERGSNAWYSLERVYQELLINFFIYFLLTLYLDQVIPGPYGTARRPWFFLTPGYWTGKEKPPVIGSDVVVAEDADESVKREAEAVVNHERDDDQGVTVTNLYKTYTSRNGCSKRSFTAVKGLAFSIQRGSLFCLLGHNGAGKTTTIGMMTGLFRATSGDAAVLGRSITTEMDAIRHVMGVCPQHDILWDELSGEDHLRLFASLKGFRGDALEEEVLARLRDVDLEHVRTKPSSSYSGGMRRRLSVAIALIGDPLIVYLDEPTTGMDPISRRKVWKLIEKKKGGRIIVLTTHSMEEADILGDCVAIMSGGQLKVIGDSLYLKKQYGTGYRVTAVLEEEGAVAECEKWIAEYFKDKGHDMEAAEKTDRTVTFDFAPGLVDLLPDFFNALEEASDLGIQDVQLNMASLEEVFLNVAKAEGGH